MHRFFIEPQTLTEDRTVWMGNHDDIHFRHLVDSFREKIRDRNWKAIDLSIRLFVKVENWDGHNVLVEDLVSRTDYYMASAYLKAGLLEKTPIVVFSHNSTPWERLKPFRAVNPRRSNRFKGGAGGPGEGTVIRSAGVNPHTEERHSGPSSLANETARSGDPDTVAGDCLIRPKQHEADLTGERTV